MDLRDYMFAVNDFYGGVLDAPPRGYNKKDKDGGFRSWLLLAGEDISQKHTETANSVIYPHVSKKQIAKEKQLSLF